MNTIEELLEWENIVDPRDIPGEIKNFNLLIKNCDYILEKLNIVEYQEENDIWKISSNTINETDLMLKNLTSILNKLTINNYDSLFNEIKNFQVIEDSIIMEKAVTRLIANIKTNQVYTVVYSKLVYDINKLDLWFYINKDNTKINFINYLLGILEKEFFSIVDIDNRQNEKKELDSIDDDDEKFEEESYYKKQKKGIILLVCSLYNKSIINNKIIEEVFRYLINPIEGTLPDENNLELLSVLFKEINSKLIKTNFWTKPSVYDIKKSLKFLMKDERIHTKYIYLLEDELNKII
jgi:hypothetical protein